MLGDMVMLSMVWLFGDGVGGMFMCLMILKGDWEIMWEKMVLNDFG